MRAIRLPTTTRVEPFGDPPGEVPVVSWHGGRAHVGTLAEAQLRAIEAAGLEAADAPAPGEPFVVYSDHTWFTAGLLKLVASGPPGRLRVTDGDFLRQTRNLQPSPELPDIALCLAGGPVALHGAENSLDLRLRREEAKVEHPAFAHAIQGPMAIGARMIHAVTHWTHLLRVNLLALAARAEEAREQWETGGVWTKARMAAPVLWRARSLNHARIAAALVPRGRNVKVHPTAVVEACDLDDDVEIGPFCWVRGCVIGKGARIDAYAQLAMSVLGPGCRVATGAMVNLCVLYPGAFVSEGGGFQMCAFGRDSFVAKTAVMLDLSFGRTIRVDAGGERVDTEGFFLGGVIGHRAKVGAGVRIGYGTAVPNDVLLVASTDDLLRTVGPDRDGPLLVRGGVAVPARR